MRGERLAPARRPLQGALWSEGCAWHRRRDWARAGSVLHSLWDLSLLLWEMGGFGGEVK